MRPGGFAEARITAGTTTAPMLPQSAVLSDEKGNYVYIINGKNEVERRDIKIGSVNDNGVTIAAGLSGNEAVVLSAGPFLNPGSEGEPEASGGALRPLGKKFKLMNFRNISSWCIRNPVGPIVLFVGLMLAGLVAFARMQVNNAPDIDFPAAIVSVSQPGAAPNEMETQVTQRVESAVRGITGVDEINSTVSEGNSTTFVSFQLGTPTDRAVNDVRNAIAQIRGNLPEGILEPQITRVDAEDEPIMVMSAQTTDMTPRAAELVHRQYGRQAAARRRRHCRRVSAAAASIARSA